jgi:hypothetical protein
MPKLIIKTILIVIAAMLPWLGFGIWELLPYDLKGNSNVVRYIVDGTFGIACGYLIWKHHIKLIILPALFVIFILSSLVWGINRFESNKLDYQMNVYDDLPSSIPACTKESNYANFWDYISNGCHYTTLDLAESYLNQILILTIAILSTRILLKVLRSKEKKKKNPSLLDQ